MIKCKFSGCEKEEAYGKNGYCDEHYRNYIKGDKINGIYAIYLKLSDGKYFYIGGTFKQDIKMQ